jgi:hypothetical protein
MRSFIAILAAAFISLTFAATDASARPGGGFRSGGFHGGFHGGGFRGFHGGFRPGFPLVGAAVGLGLAASYPYWGYPGYYAYGDGCLVPRRIWTPWGPRVRWINVCY